MSSVDQNVLQARCQHCRRLFDFKASDLGFTAPCPFCKKPTLLQEDSSPVAAPDRKKLPQWVHPTVSLSAITLIISVVLYGMALKEAWPLQALPASHRLRLFIYFFLGTALWVLGIAFWIYLFNWLREARVLLRQIEMNTRVPKAAAKPSEHSPSSSSPSESAYPTEDAKYMPKV